MVYYGQNNCFAYIVSAIIKKMSDAMKLQQRKTLKTTKSTDANNNYNVVFSGVK